ncbi:MAG: hypothetical protein KAI89_10440 [Emcibacter sp.]|nr:hypothetical protein [Emcibacter sp.]
MTYCLGIRVKEGLVCLADGRLTSGMQAHSAGKVSMHNIASREICIMTSGLRSIRDKTLAYFDDLCVKGKPEDQTSLRDVLKFYTLALRQVATEDWDALQRSNLRFDLHALIGGKLERDKEPCMYLVYPEGNWIEMNDRTIYLSIGATSYGKTFLDRTLRYDTPMETVVKIAYLSFDSTRVSAVDVGYPLDLLTYIHDEKWRHELYKYDDLASLNQWWNGHLRELIAKLPAEKKFKNLL